MNEVTSAVPAPVVAGRAPEAGRGELVSVLLVLQAALGALATVGVVVLMGSPLYAVVPLTHVVLLLVASAGVARGRRGALWTVLVVEALTLTGYEVNLLLGLLPQIDVTVNMVGLLTSVGLPAVVLWQCGRMLVRS